MLLYTKHIPAPGRPKPSPPGGSRLPNQQRSPAADMVLVPGGGELSHQGMELGRGGHERGGGLRLRYGYGCRAGFVEGREGFPRRGVPPIPCPEL